MASKAQVKNAILEREGFRVALELFDEKRPALPPFDYRVMAPHRWKVSDWKNARLAAYRLLVKGVTIYGGDGKPITRDLQLGNLRDSYYEAAYGSLEPPGTQADSKIVAMAGRPRRKRSQNNEKPGSRKRLR